MPDSRDDRTNSVALDDATIQRMYALAWRLTRHPVSDESVADSLRANGCPNELASIVVQRAKADRVRVTRREAASLFFQACFALVVAGAFVIWELRSTSPSFGGKIIVPTGALIFGAVNAVRAIRVYASGNALDA